jgi:prophage tail gpP-like protein
MNFVNGQQLRDAQWQPTYPGAKPAEIAELIVAGYRFSDWESVWVQLRWLADTPLFRFTAAERDPMPPLWLRLQFKPEDPCTIFLGGQLAITGMILTRQTAFDGNSHGVSLQGVGDTWFAARSSVMSKTSDFSGKDYVSIANEVMAPTGVPVKVVGTIDATPFKTMHNQQGETIWSFLERIGRDRKVDLGSDAFGRLLLIGEHKSENQGDLVEGENILKCQCIISIEGKYSDYVVRAQRQADDQTWGPAASEQEADAPGTIKRYSPLLTPIEHPVWTLAEVAKRAETEQQWAEGTQTQATIVVYGWFAPNSELWEPGKVVTVNSPMAMLNNIVLAIRTVTFEQSRGSGTTTTLDLVDPRMLNDHSDWNVSNPTLSQPTRGAQPTGLGGGNLPVTN